MATTTVTPACRLEPDQDTSALAHRLALAYREMAAFYRDQMHLHAAEADRRATDPGDLGERHARMLSEAPDQASWIGLQQLEAWQAGAAMEVWQHLKATARDQLTTGAYAAEPFAALAGPWDRARFVTLVEAFTDEWQPAGGIERALVQMLAQQFTEWQFWLGMLHTRQMLESARTNRDNGRWEAPRLTDAAAMDQAAAMADRFNRLYLRTLRALRDYRRYALPAVVVQNAGQVNVGQQQVNVAATPATDGAGGGVA